MPHITCHYARRSLTRTSMPSTQRRLWRCKGCSCTRRTLQRRILWQGRPDLLGQRTVPPQHTYIIYNYQIIYDDGVTYIQFPTSKINEQYICKLRPIPTFWFHYWIVVQPRSDKQNMIHIIYFFDAPWGPKNLFIMRIMPPVAGSQLRSSPIIT